MIDWPATAARLGDTTQDVSDDELDALAAAALGAPEAVGAGPALRAALPRVRHALTQRSIALALAVAAPSDDDQAVDVLRAVFDTAETDAFAGPSLLHALGLLALRSDVARAELVARLLRLHDPNAGLPERRYLLVAASRVIGWTDAARTDAGVRRLLARLAASSDAAVEAEARQQLAHLALADALGAPDFTALRTALTEARAAFARAAACEEHRPDAQLFEHLLDMVVALAEAAPDPRTAAPRIRASADAVFRLLSGPTGPGWHGYASAATEILFARICEATRCLLRAAAAAETAEAWTNFDDAMLGLATAVATMRIGQAAATDARIEDALRTTGERVLPAALGAWLRRVVGLARLDHVVARAGDGIADGVRDALHVLRAAARAAPEPPVAVPDALASALQRAAARVGATPTAMLAELGAALDAGRAPPWLDSVGLLTATLTIDRPGLFGADPAVDAVTRRLLRELRDRLAPYDPVAWSDVVLAVESVVSFVRYVGDTAPPYTLCDEDGGMGQKASEHELQVDLYKWLRMKFGAGAWYEHEPVAGGRPDSGLRLAKAQLPIEVKHEFISVERDRVREHFLVQPDGYAAARDRVAFLLVLDLRDGNAAGHLKRVRAARKAKNGSAAVSAYTLDEAFWVDGLPPDPQIAGARPKAVIAGMILGNRPKPSSTTDYSDRPKPASAGPTATTPSDAGPRPTKA